MALDPKYITDDSLEDYFVSKDTGLPLAGGTITFYRDSSRITPKPVYELTGAPPNYTYTPLPNPITLSAVGTPQNAGGDNVSIYYYPWLASDPEVLDLYYVVVKDSNGVVQFTREARPNSAIEGGGTGSDNLPVQNQISNPQFSQVLINYVPTLSPSTTTYTVSGSQLEFEVAPNWTLVVNGTGNVVIERVAISGSLVAPTNPPYSLNVSVDNTITTCYLRQRFDANSGLWTSTANQSLFLSSGIVVKNLINVSTQISMEYKASNGVLSGSPVTLLSETIGPSSDYTYYTGTSIEMPLSDDTNSGNAGYVDIYISFTPGSSVSVTSVQVVPVVNVLAAPTLAYDNASSNRAEALMGDYYIPRLISSTRSSLLTAWDFPLNPAQFLESQSITTNAAYVWDQTICAVSSGTVAVTRDSATGSISMLPNTNNQSMYMLQYLSGAQAKEMLHTRLSSNINAFLGAGGGNVHMSVYLYVADSGTSFPVLSSSVVTISSSGAISGVPAGWNIIPRSGLDTPRAIVPSAAHDADGDIQFSGWEITNPTQLSDTDKFAMVVTFTWDTATRINVSSISLNKGDLPSRPSPQTASDVLSECQFYYEKTKNPNVALTTAGAEGCVLAMQDVLLDNVGLNGNYLGRSFGIQYKTNKRTAPTITFYSVDGTINNIQAVKNTTGSQTNTNVLASLWTQDGAGLSGTYFRYSTGSVLVSGSPSFYTELYILFHFSADARIGIV